MVSISYPASFLATSGTLGRLISHSLEIPPKPFLLSFWDEGQRQRGWETQREQVRRSSLDCFFTR